MQLSQLKGIIRPFVPVGLLELNSRYQRGLNSREEQEGERQQEEIARRERFEGLRHVVGEKVAAIAVLTEQQCVDAAFLENEFIPSLGLNDEILDEQPSELSASFGKGLHLWQYPSQLAGYLVWLARNAAGISSYLEIGCRWGGMFILVSEWIRKNGGQLRAVTAVDLIPPTPFIRDLFRAVTRPIDCRLITNTGNLHP